MTPTQNRFLQTVKESGGKCFRHGISLGGRAPYWYVGAIRLRGDLGDRLRRDGILVRTANGTGRDFEYRLVGLPPCEGAMR